MKPMLHGLLASLLLVAATTGARADTQLDEGFNSGLPAGWIMANFSDNPAGQAWFQPLTTPDVFSAQNGAADSYLASNVFVGVTTADGEPTGKIDAMLATPMVSMAEATVLSFWTRTVSGNSFGDGLRVGAIIAGSFVDLLAINPALTASAYPEDWTHYTIKLPGQGEGINGRFYFEYLVPDASKAGNFIGLDSVSVADALAPVPEPTTGALLLAGAALLLHLKLRRLAR